MCFAKLASIIRAITPFRRFRNVIRSCFSTTFSEPRYTGGNRVCKHKLNGDNLPELIDGRWWRRKQLGSGGYGDVFEAQDFETGENFALKVESQTESSSQSSVQKEVQIYEEIQKVSPRIIGFPNLHSHGNAGRSSFLVMDLLGESLSALRRKNGYASIRFALTFGIQAINRIENLHSLGYVHSDIKPHNFLVGKCDPERIYLIDFGQTRKFREADGAHIAKRMCFFRGTRAFASPNVNRGWEHSRRDDLISLGYSILYMLGPDLPWFNIFSGGERTSSRSYFDVSESKRKTEYNTGTMKFNSSLHSGQMIAEQQQELSINEVCQEVPVMEKFFKHVLGLEFEEKPDYRYLREELADALLKDIKEE